MNRRALVLALVFALLGTALLLLYVRRFEQEMSGGDHVELLMTIRPIERGAVLTDEMLTVRRIPLAYVEDRAVKAAERAKVIGLQTSTELSPQQTLMWTDLAITTEDRDLSSLVQPGKRGVTVRASAGDQLAGNALIRPGDYVDVIATMQDQGQQASVVLLQRVLVLAVGGDTQAPAAGAAASGRVSVRDKLLTLSLSVQEAQLLSLAQERGRLSFMVRGISDPTVQSDVPDMKASALLDTQTRTDVQRPTPRAGPVKIQATSR